MKLSAASMPSRIHRFSGHTAADPAYCSQKAANRLDASGVKEKEGGPREVCLRDDRLCRLAAVHVSNRHICSDESAARCIPTRAEHEHKFRMYIPACFVFLDESKKSQSSCSERGQQQQPFRFWLVLTAASTCSQGTSLVSSAAPSSSSSSSVSCREKLGCSNTRTRKGGIFR